MKFTCEKNSIQKEIAIAQEIISTRNVLSILSNVLLVAENNTITIKATDLKVGFETQIPADIAEEGSTTVFCDKFLGILRSLPIVGLFKLYVPIRQRTKDSQKLITKYCGTAFFGYIRGYLGFKANF